MPWCGYWGAGGASGWWVLPLIGLALLGVMFFVCARRSGCLGGPRRPHAGLSDLQRDVEALEEEVRKLAR